MSKHHKKKDDFIQKAFYQGGVEAMKEFILSNLKYPEEAAANKIEGTVHVQYHINQKGIVFKAKTLTNHGYGLEEEAIRLIKMLKFEVPQKTRGLKVIFNKTTHIHFRLPKTPPVPEPVAQPVVQPVEAKPAPQKVIVENPTIVNYTIKKKPTTSKIYTYTIKGE